MVWITTIFLLHKPYLSHQLIIPWAVAPMYLPKYPDTSLSGVVGVVARSGLLLLL